MQLLAAQSTAANSHEDAAQPALRSTLVFPMPEGDRLCVQRNQDLYEAVSQGLGPLCRLPLFIHRIDHDLVG